MLQNVSDDLYLKGQLRRGHAEFARQLAELIDIRRCELVRKHIAEIEAGEQVSSADAAVVFLLDELGRILEAMASEETSTTG
jgi:hypothetical protein